MKYKISMSTYNMDIIQAFSLLGNKKSQYIEQAVLNFLATAKGKDTLRLIAEYSRKSNHNAATGKRTRSEQEDRVEKKSDRIYFDSFLA